MAEKKVEHVVASGRTVRVDGKHYGPGAKVAVSAEDAKHLLERGFLHNPKAEAANVGNGPTFAAEDGPSIQEA